MLCPAGLWYIFVNGICLVLDQGGGHFFLASALSKKFTDPKIHLKR